MKPFISNKCRSSENIILVKGDDTISDKGQVANTFNESFANVVKNLKITINEDILSDTKDTDDPILIAIKKYKKHPSIRAIKDISKNNTFSFQKVSYEKALKEIQKLDARKACQNTDVSTKIIKNNSDIFGDFIYQNFNDAIENDMFPKILKNANVSPVFKKGSRNCETNQTNKSQNFLMKYYLSTNAVSEKALAHSTVWHQC